MRNTAIDIAKAVGILLMILGHCDELNYMPYRHFIFTFHMPLFFILSGYFFKSKDAKTVLNNEIRHLMFPYFLTCGGVILLTLVKSFFSGNFRPVLYYGAASLIGSGAAHKCVYLSNLPVIGAIWFFPALFVCKYTYNAFSNYSVEKRLFFSFIIYLSATLIGRYIIFVPFSVLCGLSPIIFYAIGDYYKFKKPQIKPIYLFVGLFCWILSFFFSQIHLVQPRTDLYIVDILGATTATYLVYKVSKGISVLFPKSDILPWIGRNSMYILCFHLIDNDLKISKVITQNTHIIYLILSMLIIPLVSTWLFVTIKKRIDN